MVKIWTRAAVSRRIQLRRALRQPSGERRPAFIPKFPHDRLQLSLRRSPERESQIMPFRGQQPMRRDRPRTRSWKSQRSRFWHRLPARWEAMPLRLTCSGQPRRPGLERVRPRIERYTPTLRARARAAALWFRQLPHRYRLPLRRQRRIQASSRRLTRPRRSRPSPREIRLAAFHLLTRTRYRPRLCPS